MGFLSRARGLSLSALVLVLGLVGVLEATQLVAGIEIDGAMYSPESFYGFVGKGSWTDAFAAWHAYAHVPNGNPAIESWLHWGVYLDLLVVLGVAGLLLGLRTRWGLTEFPLWVVLALPVADLVEDVVCWLCFAAVSGPADAGPPTLLLTAATAATWVKWGAVVLIAVMLRVRRIPDAALRTRLRGGVHALGAHRFQLVVVGLLAVLLLVPGGPILEQAIDIERSWLLTAAGGANLRFLVAAFAAAGLLAAMLRYLSSVQTAVVGGEPPSPTGRNVLGGAVWLGLAAAGVVMAWLLQRTGLAEVYWPVVWSGAVVLATVGGVSLVLRKGAEPDPRPSAIDDDGVLVWQVGRIIAFSALTVLLVGMARAFIAPLILGQYRATSVLTIVVSILTAGAVVLLGALGDTPDFLYERDKGSTGQLRLRRLQPQLAGASGGTANGWLSSLLPGGAAALVLSAAVIVWPVSVSRALGGIAMVMLGFAALTGFYTVLRIVSQMTAPPRVFRVLRLRRTPLIGLVVVIALGATLVGASTPVHRIRQLPQRVPAERPLLADAVEQWLEADHDGCDIDVLDSGDVTVRPMVFVAAEGGGARAAWWTVSAMDAMTTTACGGRNLFVTSGVSGGAIGLALSATAVTPSASQTARAAVEQLVDETALAGALGGLLSRDLVGGVTGVQARAADTADGDDFPDRATLLEQGWEREVPALAQPFPFVTPPPWRTMFNGTSVTRHCRVVTGDIDLGADSTTCAGSTVPGAYDLFRAYDCLDGALRTTTAALLAARFPYVTPSGMIPRCPGGSAPVDQVIDGGYAENTGLDTLDALLVAAMPAVRTWNAAQLAGTRPELVVPVAVFLHNTATAVIGQASRPSRPAPEVVIPPTNLGASAVLGDPATLLADFKTTAAEWLPTGVGDASLRAAVDSALPSQGVTVAPARIAQLEFPLGWTLSNATRRALDRGFAPFAACGAPGDVADVPDAVKFRAVFPCPG